MSKNSKAIWLVLIGAVVLLALVWVGRDLFLSRSGSIECDDGRRRTIDIRDFITQYSDYSVGLEAAVSDKKLTRSLILFSFSNFLNLSNMPTSFANFWWWDTTPVR